MTRAKFACGVGLWSLALGFVLQRWLLPATPWHAGHGLMAGHDWVFFHGLAAELAHEVQAGGWSAWEYRFHEQAPASYLSLFYGLTGIEEPWVALPFQALLYALAGWSLFSIATGIGLTGIWRALALLPLFFPSTLAIYGQPHKDILTLPGTLLVAQAWLMAATAHQTGRRETLEWAGAALVGTLLCWWARPYLALILLAMGAFIYLVAGGWALRRQYMARLVALTVVLAVAAGAYALGKALDGSRVAPVQDSTVGVERTAAPCTTWNPEVRLPGVDDVVRGLFCYRHHFIRWHPSADANVDFGRMLVNYREALGYLPRALQIGVLAPFPSHWLFSDESSAGRVMRAISGVEMLLCYVVFAGLAIAGWRQTQAWAQVWPLIVIAIIGILFYVYTSPNVGSIYRYRLPFFMLLWITGVWGWSAGFKRKSIWQTPS